MKKTRAGKCIHCLRYVNKITADHIIPESWYSNYSKHIYKPKAPACYECNQNLGKQEKKLSHLMWICMPEDNILREELIAKVYRACGLMPDGKPMPELSDKERNIRKLYARELFSLARSQNSHPSFKEESIFPGFGYHAHYTKEMQSVVLLDIKLIESVAIKVVRGLEYIQQRSGRYIEKPYKLEVYFPRNSDDPSLRVVREKSPIFSDGTNLIQRAAVPDRPLEPIYIIRLWNQWEIWGAIIHEDRKFKD